MPAPKGNKYGLGGPGGGRPTKYKPEYADQAYGIALLGATDAGIAAVFGVGETTIKSWKHKHKAFSDALKKGKEVADSEIQKKLFNRALGLTTKETKKLKRKIDGKEVIEITETEREIPPETTACIFWLKNRQPDQWREKKEVELTNPPEVKIYMPDNGRE